MTNSNVKKQWVCVGREEERTTRARKANPEDIKAGRATFQLEGVEGQWIEQWDMRSKYCRRPSELAHLSFSQWARMMEATNGSKKVDDEESPEVAKQVIDRGANLNIPNRDGETAVMVAIRRKNRSVLELLLGAKANLEVTNAEGKNALWLALQSDDKHDDSDSIASLIIAAGADPSSLCNSDGDSLLHSLASVGKEEAGLYLVSVGANVNLVNMRGETVLHLAAHQGLATLATALLVAGAEPNLQTQSNAGEVWRQSALHLALAAGQETVVTCLLEFSQV